MTCKDILYTEENGRTRCQKEPDHTGLHFAIVDGVAIWWLHQPQEGRAFASP